MRTRPSMPTPSARRCEVNIARWPSIRMAPITSTRDAGLPPVSDMTMSWSPPCRMRRWNPLPASPIHSQCGRWWPANVWSMLERARVSIPLSRQVGPSGRVIGVDMTDEMLAKSRSTAAVLGIQHVEFREGLAERLPVEDGWADVVISNGVINLCADKRAVFAEIHRVLRPDGVLQFADIANGQPVPGAAINNIDLWTA